MSPIMDQLINLPTLDINMINGITDRYAIVDVLSTNPSAYKYLAWGDGMLRKAERGHIGEPFFHIKDDPEYRKEAIARWQPAIFNRVPVVDIIQTTIYGRNYNYKRLVMPFGDFNGRATKILIYSEIVD